MLRLKEKPLRLQQGAFLASRAKERYHDHGATSQEGVSMDLSEIVTRTLNDKQLRGALTNCLEKLKGRGSEFPRDVSDLLCTLARGAATLYSGRPPISEGSSTWKNDCATMTRLYLDSEDAKRHISKEWRHLVAAHIQGSEENKSLLDELCKRAVTTALLVQAGIEPRKFYN